MDETKKQQILLAVVAFNITIIVFQLAFNSSILRGPTVQFSAMKLLLGILLAGGAAGIGYFVGGRGA